jgi:hypothetical protein
VLLIGADLRNPQLHSLGVDRNINGLTNYLADNTEDWKSFFTEKSDYSENLHVLFSGEIRPNPSQLLTNNFQLLSKRPENFTITLLLILRQFKLYLMHLPIVLWRMLQYLWCVLTIQRKYFRRLNNFVKRAIEKNVGIVINGVSKKWLRIRLQLQLQLSEQSERSLGIRVLG